MKKLKNFIGKLMRRRLLLKCASVNANLTFSEVRALYQLALSAPDLNKPDQDRQGA